MYEEYQSRSGRTQADEKDYTSRYVCHECGYVVHSLSGNWVGFRECHIAPDWLLIYQIDGKELILFLTRTGTHADLLGM